MDQIIIIGRQSRKLNLIITDSEAIANNVNDFFFEYWY